MKKGYFQAILILTILVSSFNAFSQDKRNDKEIMKLIKEAKKFEEEGNTPDKRKRYYDYDTKLHDIYQKLIKLDPNNPTFLYMLAEFFTKSESEKANYYEQGLTLIESRKCPCNLSDYNWPSNSDYLNCNLFVFTGCCQGLADYYYFQDKDKYADTAIYYLSKAINYFYDSNGRRIDLSSPSMAIKTDLKMLLISRGAAYERKKMFDLAKIDDDRRKSLE